MADNRFKDFPVDARFTAPGVDIRFQVVGLDVRFPSPGQDNRFMGDSYTGAPFAVTITGTGAVGETLTVADFGTYDSVQWTRDGSAIGSATAGTYTVVEADEDTTIRCEGTIGADTVASNGIFVEVVAGGFSFDSNSITFDSNTRTFDEAA